MIQKNMFNDVSFFGMVNFLIPIYIKFQMYILKYTQFVKVICNHLETRNRMYNFLFFFIYLFIFFFTGIFFF